MPTVAHIRGPRWLAEDYGPMYREILRPMLTALGQQLRAAAQSEYGGTRFAGSFGMSTRTAPYAQITLTQSNPLFKYVEEYTKPHTIVAHKGWALRFQVAGRVGFARWVNHPGTKGKYLMPPLADEYADKFYQVLAEAAKQAAYLGEVTL